MGNDLATNVSRYDGMCHIDIRIILVTYVSQNWIECILNLFRNEFEDVPLQFKNVHARYTVKLVL